MLNLSKVVNSFLDAKYIKEINKLANNLNQNKVHNYPFEIKDITNVLTVKNSDRNYIKGIKNASSNTYSRIKEKADFEFYCSNTQFLKGTRDYLKKTAACKLYSK